MVVVDLGVKDRLPLGGADVTQRRSGIAPRVGCSGENKIGGYSRLKLPSGWRLAIGVGKTASGQAAQGGLS